MSAAETKAKPRVPAAAPMVAPIATPLPPARWRLSWLRASPGVAAVLLLAAGASLIDTILDELRAPLLPASSSAEPPAPPAPAPAALPTLKPIASYGETVARPLFSPIRRAPAPAAAPAAVGDVSNIIVTGIIVGAHQSHAFIQRGQPNQTTRIVEGQQLDGWTVKSILPDRIVLQHGAIERELKAGRPH